MEYLNLGLILWVLLGSHHVAYSIGKEPFTSQQIRHPFKTLLDIILNIVFWPLLYF